MLWQKIDVQQDYGRIVLADVEKKENRPMMGHRFLPLTILLALAIEVGHGRLIIAQAPRVLTEARNRMVDEEIVAAGITDPRVIQAMRDTPRHEFIPTAQRKSAYFDMALPIGNGQTISPPFVVAFMTEQLEPQPEHKVLEIGTGSGYQAAVLSPLVKEVYSIEIVEPLGVRAAQTLKRLKYANVHTKIGDGYQGWPEHAPFDGIIVTCSPENVPQPLIDQLKEGGRMIIPVGERYQQTIYRYTKIGGKLDAQKLLPTIFVPMTGAAEEQRKVLPDPANPKLVNGGFEETNADGSKPSGWHYQRQLELFSSDPPSGERFVTFSNESPGRGSQALQAMAIDGRQIREIEVSLMVRAANVGPGPVKELPGLGIVFYDEQRRIVGEGGVGPWRGSFAWKKAANRIRVPVQAREAIIRIGLLGATGQVSLDEIALTPTKRD
jgi:protein-L-isoaspartate(D-aspartate) O-methyltransferase